MAFALRRVCALCLWLALAGLVAACGEEDSPEADLREARAAMQDLDWVYAERCFVRYLRKVDDTEARWQAWQGLLTIVTRAGHMDPRAALDYLEVMVAEYNGNDARLRVLLPRLGALALDMHRHERALEAWDEYTQLSGLSEEESINGHSQLARLYVHMGRYAAAEDALQNALSESQSEEGRAVLLYELAELQSLREQWQEAVDLGLQVLESSTDAVLRGRACFLLGDASEQLKKPDDALRYFQLARAGYPNTLAVDKRIALLHKGASRRERDQQTAETKGAALP